MKSLKIVFTLISISIITVLTIYIFFIDKENFKNISEFELKPQFRSHWCWAANIQMIDNYFGGSKTQCEIVNDESESCTNDQKCDCQTQSIIHDMCDINLSEDEFFTLPSKYIEKFKALNITSEVSDTLLSFRDIRNEINENRPVLLSGVTCASCGIWDGHAITISGYLSTPSQKFVYINDPWSIFSNSSNCTGCNYYLSYDALFNRRKDTNLTNQRIFSAEITSIYNFQKTTSFSQKSNTFQILKTYFNNVYQNYFFDNNKIDKKYIEPDNTSSKMEKLIKLSLQDILKYNQLSFKLNIDNLQINKPISFEGFNFANSTITKTEDVYIINITDSRNNVIMTITILQDETKKDFFIESISTTCNEWLVPPSFVKFDTPNSYSIVRTTPFGEFFYKGLLQNEIYYIPIDTYLRSPNNFTEKPIFIKGSLYKEEVFFKLNGLRVAPYSKKKKTLHFKPTATPKPSQRLRGQN